MGSDLEIHVIYTPEGECDRLTLSELEALDAMQAGRTVNFNEHPTIAALETALVGWTEKLGDKEWQALAPYWLETLYCTPLKGDVMPKPALYRCNPVDMPCVIAAKRLEILDQYGGVADLQVRIELTEIVQATKNSRFVNSELFSDDSLAVPSFHQLYADPVKTLSAGIHELDQLFSELQKSIHDEIATDTALTRDAWADASKAFAVKSSELAEISYLIEEAGIVGHENYAFHESWGHLSHHSQQQNSHGSTD